MILGGALASQFNMGENTTSTLDAVIDGQNVKYGSLGDFASQFDQSAQRSYVEEGYLRVDPYNTDPKQFQILWQEPSATVLVKKRMFSSIAENYRPDFMDADERTYWKAMRILFQNKCSQIAALEQLSKLQQVTSAVGNVAQQLVPVIITLADVANNGFGTGSNFFGLLGGSNPFTTQGASNFFNVVDRLRTLYAFNQSAQTTTWLTDPSDLLQSTFGGGSGVIEITNFTNLSTTTSVDLKSPGHFSLTISDPYQAMLITDYDIEVALSDATNLFYNSKAFQFGQTTANQVIADQQNKLNNMRQLRNASPISFKLDPDTLLGKRVTAIIDRLGVSIPFTYDPFGGLIGSDSAVNVPDDYLRGGNIAGYDGLDTATAPIGPDHNIKPLVGSANTEKACFNSIVTAIYQQIMLMSNSANSFISNTQNYNYARRRLRFNFSGKLIIQPMDTIHVYMNSKSQFDNKILAGLQQMFTGNGVLQSFANTLNSLTQSFDATFNPSANVSLQAEKAMYVGPDFPDFLWAIVRGMFTSEIEGTHVFAGVVEHAVDNWADGHFTINVDGKDNSFYFDQGKVNFKPGADSFNGLIFDPLTPFKSSFDSFSGTGASGVTPNTSNSPVLLDENVYLLSQTGASTLSLVKHKLGALAGQKATTNNYIQDQSIDPVSGRLTRTFYAPDGLVYKWKQGIGVYTQAGSSSTINDPNLVGNPNIYEQPFAGLDVMNVLSLLITGTPYNYATYFQATANLNGVQGDPSSGQSATHGYLTSLKNDLAKRNTLWGNFMPFKNLFMNESAIAQAQQAQFTISNANTDLDSKLAKFRDINNALVNLGAVNGLVQQVKGQQDPSVNSQISDLTSQMTSLQTGIQSAISSIQAETKTFFSQVSTSASYDSNYLINGQNNPSDSAARQLLRKQTNYLTRRMSYDVRANQDKNLFIVDDYYDVDYDIAAFNKALTNGIQMYSNDYLAVRDKIIAVADLLNLEVFCDSQGHIRCRPPQYNRMPSSVFYRMLYLKQVLGVQIYPQFLNGLFTNQYQALQNQIQVIEDQIRLDCAILGQYPSLDNTGDLTAMQWILNNSISAGQGSVFLFVSDGASGTITDFATLIQQANNRAAGIDTSVNAYSNIQWAGANTLQVFTNADKYSVLYSALQSQIAAATNKSSGTPPVPTTAIFQSTVVQQLVSRIEITSGQVISSKDYLTSAGPNQPLEVDTGQTIDFFKVADELTNYIGQWQTAIKAFYLCIKNAAEFQSLDDGTSTANALQNPGLFNNAYIPEVYEHMIEDETYDDYGPNSGTRYIVKNGQIKSLSIAENAPPWTSVEVQGTLPYFSETSGGGGPAGLANFPGGGNGLVTALAIDYDMWRNYGFKEQAVVHVPFLQDPLTQCGPYAAMILTRNRANILQGTCTISGNEFMQPGEVIFLEDRNLLFYVNSVTHSFAEGGSFTTTLDLKYGHSVGEYIPTYMDTVGKLIYKNQDTVNTIIHRQDSSAPEQNLGVVQFDGNNTQTFSLNTGSESQQANDNYAAANTTVVNNILYTTQYVVNANGNAGNNVQANVELRLYYDNQAGGTDTNLYFFAQNVKNALVGATQGPVSNPSTNQPVLNPTLPSSSVKIIGINIDDTNN